MPRSRSAKLPPRGQVPSQTAEMQAVQCATCGTFRLVPDRKDYEEIREHIYERPWVCADAVKWREDASCDNPDEVSSDPNLIVLSDKPGIPATPDGWKRVINVRTTSKVSKHQRRYFSDVSYYPPAGQGSSSSERMRSYGDIQRAVQTNPDLQPLAGNIRERFSFSPPGQVELQTSPSVSESDASLQAD